MDQIRRIQRRILMKLSRLTSIYFDKQKLKTDWAETKIRRSDCKDWRVNEKLDEMAPLFG